MAPSSQNPNALALSAGGKLFLSGEYAVLWGGVARIACVGPRTFALVRRRSDRRVELVLEEGRLTGQTTPLGVHWKGELPPSHRFAARTLELALRLHGRECAGFELALSPSPLSEEGHKLGMGGSGRAAVLAAAAARFALEDAALDPLKLALFAHAHAQEGRGSGGDVAASHVGGWIRYRRFGVERLLEEATSPLLRARWDKLPEVEATALPAIKLPLLYVFSGQSASTPKLIGRAEERMGAAERRSFVARSDAHGEALERALREGDPSAVSSACDALVSLLSGLGEWVTGPSAEILERAHRFGASGKPSGAGGGDGCIVFCPDEATRAKLIDDYRIAGIFSQPISLEPGVRAEEEPSPALQAWLDA